VKSNLLSVVFENCVVSTTRRDKGPLVGDFLFIFFF